MSDRPRWTQALARFARPAGHVTAPEQNTKAADVSDGADLTDDEPVFVEESQLSPADQETAEFWAWVERDNIVFDLGHTELKARIRERADVAQFAADYETARALLEAADNLAEHEGWDEDFAIRDAMALPEQDRQALFDARREAIKARTATNPVMRLVEDVTRESDQVQGVDENTAGDQNADAAPEVDDFAEASRLQHEQRVESDVRAAYDMSLLIAADNGVPDKRWVRLSELHAELDYQAHQRGHEPHSKEEIDAALQRLTHDQSTTMHVIPEDHAHLLTAADHAAAARFGDADRHLIYIDDSEAVSEPTNDLDDSSVDETAVVVTDEAVADETPTDGRAVETPTQADRGDAAELDGAAAEIEQGVETAPSDASSNDDADSTEPAEQDHTDKSRQPVDQRADTEPTAAAADPRNSASSDGAAAVTADEAADVEPVAVTETTACTVAVTRARCAVERVQQQLDVVEQEAAAERDDELARWHADDTAAQFETERVADDTAQLDSAPVRGGS